MNHIFMSYKWEDRHRVDTIISWGEAGRLGDVSIFAEAKDLRQQGEDAVFKYLNPRLKSANTIIVLVGEDTHTSDYVVHEIQHALSHQKEIIVVRIPNTSGGIPHPLQNYYEIAFEPNIISRYIE